MLIVTDPPYVIISATGNVFGPFRSRKHVQDFVERIGLRDYKFESLVDPRPYGG